MNRLIVPVVSFGLTFIAFIVYIFLSGKNKATTKTTGNDKSKTSQFFINVVDIHDDILYGLDGYKRIFYELEGVCIDLLNNNDIKRLIKELSSEISKLNFEFDLFTISRPFNIENLKEQYENDILNAKTDIQRTLLRSYLKQILEFGENGEVVERKFYLIIQGLENEGEIIKQGDNLSECFKACGLVCNRLKNPDIKRLINLFNNISTYNYDNMDNTDFSIPEINIELQKEKTIDEKLKEKFDNNEKDDNSNKAEEEVENGKEKTIG